MTSIPQPKPMRLSTAITGPLAALRRAIRGYVCADGTAVVCTVIGGAFWCGLFVDWFFEPPVWARTLMLVAVVVVLVGVIITRIVLRLRTPLSDASMALLLERRFPRLDDSLITAVELVDDYPPEHEGFSSAMLTDTCRRAEKRLAGLTVDEVIDRGPLRRHVAAASVLLLSIILFAVFVPRAFGVWTRRGLLMSNELWPRQTRLVVDGFENGVKKVARGSDVDIVALADCKMPLVPKTVEVRYRIKDGSRRRSVMNREGNAVVSGDAWQRYSHAFHSLLDPVEFAIHGGDVTIEGLRLEVVESPTVDKLWFSCEYPAYMNLPPRRQSVISPIVEVPFGTRVTVVAHSDKDLQRVEIDELEGGRQKDQFVIDMAAKESSGSESTDLRHFTYDLDLVEADRVIAFSLVDNDGIKSRRPLQVNLVVTADEPPELQVSLSGIGSAVTPQARLPVEGHVNDDHGIARLWFEVTDEKSVPQQVELTKFQGNPNKIELAADATALDLEGRGAVPGQKLLVALKAADRFDLGNEPNIGTSQRWLLDVVTPARLQAILQAHELLLRQRYEAIIAEVSETRNLLTRVEFGKPKNAAAVDDSPAIENDILAVQELRCDRALQNCMKNAHEVHAAARGFEDVCMQLVNNRIDTEEMRTRLQAGIVEPLDHIAVDMFPKVEDVLRELRRALADPVSGPAKRTHAELQLDSILLEMNRVLGRMLELEDYSEAIAILRSIIDEQKKLGGRIKQSHKDKLRKLLED